MYASVTSGKVKPSHIDDYLNTFQMDVTPIASAFPGIVDLYVIVDRETDEAMSITIYETKADADRTQQSGDFQKALGKIANHLLIDTIQRRGYEVGVKL